MSSREAVKLLNSIERAKKQKYNARLLRAFKRARYEKMNSGFPERGSAASKALYGDSYVAATPNQRVQRMLSGFRGQGGYFMQKLFGAKKGSWLDRAGDFVADTALPMAGPYGAALSKAINVGGNIASSVFPVSGAGMYLGRGAYSEPAANALMAVDADHSGASTVPVVSSVGNAADGGVMIRHKEYVSDIYAQGLGFENGHFTVNPGLERTFPWLAQVAANFTEYTLHQCVFTYKSAIAPIGASATGQVGSIIMAAQYNVSDEPFSTKQQMLLESGACADMLTRDMIFGIECDPRKLSGDVGKYIRSGPVITQADSKTYDHAILNIATDSLPAGYLNQNVGELWVEYTVELRKPRLYTGAGDAISRDIWGQMVPSGGQIPPPGNPLFPAPVGLTARANTWYRPFIGNQAMVRAQQSSIGTLLQNTTNTIVFPAGYAGHVILKLRLAADQVLAYPAGWVGSPSGFTFVTTGNIATIADIPTETGFSSSVQSVVFNTGVSPIVCTLEVHLRIDLASNGVDNTLTFTTPFQSNQVVDCPAASVCASALLDIQEYNTTLNYKQNGSNDAVVFVDNITGAVVPWTG